MDLIPLRRLQNRKQVIDGRNCKAAEKPSQREQGRYARSLMRQFYAAKSLAGEFPVLKFKKDRVSFSAAKLPYCFDGLL